MNAIGMTVNYKSGEMIVTTRRGTVEQVRNRSNGKNEYFVRWANGDTGWYLSSNLSF